MNGLSTPTDGDDRGYSLQVGALATADVKSLLHLAVRPHLQDVRAMLRLPLPEAGITAGCNFAAVHVLLNVLSGLSRLLVPGPANSGKAFKAFVERFYPWRMEPPGSRYRKRRGTEVLYDSFRTGFSHDLGLLLETTPLPGGVVRARIRTEGRELGVAKQPSLSRAALVELDAVDFRPDWLGPTVAPDGRHGLLIDAVALYWGVRRLVFDFTSRRKPVFELRRMLESVWEQKKAAGHVVTVSWSATAGFALNGKHLTPSQLSRRLAARRRRRST